MKNVTITLDDPEPRRASRLQQFPLTPWIRSCNRNFAAFSTVRASDRGDAMGIFGLSGNCCLGYAKREIATALYYDLPAEAVEQAARAQREARQ